MSFLVYVVIEAILETVKLRGWVLAVKAGGESDRGICRALLWFAVALSVMLRLTKKLRY